VPENVVDVVNSGDDEAADRAHVESERSEIREFVKGLTPGEIKSGGWFTRLLSQSLNSYTEKVDWQSFQGNRGPLRGC